MTQAYNLESSHIQLAIFYVMYLCTFQDESKYDKVNSQLALKS